MRANGEDGESEGRSARRAVLRSCCQEVRAGLGLLVGPAAGALAVASAGAAGVLAAPGAGTGWSGLRRRSGQLPQPGHDDGVGAASGREVTRELDLDG